ncbi:ELWxxDGT repeat protein [Chitinophagaceae bacterium MMS25-I14]
MKKTILFLTLLLARIGSSYAQVPTLLKDIYPGSGGSDPFKWSDPVVFNNKVYFQAMDYYWHWTLYASDGTPAGTYMVKDIYPNYDASPSGFTAYKGKLYFAAVAAIYQGEMWTTDGTLAGTNMFLDLNTPYSSWPHGFTELNNKLYFNADDGVHGTELWVTDGTIAGTQLVKDINITGAAGSNPSYFYKANGKIYFAANDGVHGLELWVTDGTTAGTQLLKDINTTTQASSYSQPCQFYEYNGLVYFNAYEPAHGGELWVTDGTTAGTYLFKDINPASTGNSYSYAQYFTTYNGKMYFSATNGIDGQELWVSDGTSAGTYMFKNINPNASDSSSNPANFKIYNGLLYFTAKDGVHGTELWTTDGTAAGTQMFQDINPAGNSYPSFLTEYFGQLYFIATDGTVAALWTTDGNVAHTHAIMPPTNNPSPFGMQPSLGMVVANKKLIYQAAYDTATGVELYAYDISAGNFSLLSPVQNTRLVTVPGNTTPVTFKWQHANNAVSYRFILDTLSGSFSPALLSINTADTFTHLTPGQLDTLISGMVSVGDSIDMKWTVKAFSNVDSTIADTSFTLRLVRGSATGITATVQDIADIYPNPAGKTIYINLQSTADATIIITSIDGVALLQKSVNDKHCSLDVSALPPGHYLVQVKTACGNMTKKILKL